ncbi:hypothetical protein L7F22_029392 [Adiantum nelumboides]|nr:hypothetical protein [Adiantum nelumboides]
MFKWPTSYMTCRTVDVTIAYVPRGYLPVYVGKHNDAHRYLIKAKHLNHPLFVHLLEVVAQEYGYSNNGILNIVCEIELFEKVFASSSHKDPHKSTT